MKESQTYDTFRIRTNLCDITTVFDNQTTVFGLFNLYNKMKVTYSGAGIEYLFSRISLRMHFVPDYGAGL